MLKKREQKNGQSYKNASETDATICIRHQYISNQTMLLAVYQLSIQVILQQQQHMSPTVVDRVIINQPSHTHTHTFNGPLSGTTRVSRYQKGKTNLDFTKARDSEWQWNLLGHMQVCTSLQTDNHASTPPLSFLQAGCHSCRPTNSVKALKAIIITVLTLSGSLPAQHPGSIQ